MDRVNWDTYFMNIAEVVATRATCNRKHVGAIIVKDRRILCTGYNGSVRGAEHCGDDNHLMENGHCVRTVHAEANAIAQAAMNGIPVLGATLYVTALPCWPCFKLIANAGVNVIVYGEAYRASEHLDRLKSLAAHVGVAVRPLVEEKVIEND